MLDVVGEPTNHDYVEWTAARRVMRMDMLGIRELAYFTTKESEE